MEFQKLEREDFFEYSKLYILPAKEKEQGREKERETDCIMGVGAGVGWEWGGSSPQSGHWRGGFQEDHSKTQTVTVAWLILTVPRVSIIIQGHLPHYHKNVLWSKHHQFPLLFH